LSSIIPILKQKGITPYIAEWIMGSEIPRIWPSAVYMRVYPLAKYFSAFDFCISAAGYNSFHELIIYGIPTIFIANEHQSMDDQDARAQFAMRNDAAMLISEEDVHRIGPMIDLIMQEKVRSLMAASCKAIRPVNGAVHAAEVIEALITDGLSMMPKSAPRAQEQAA
jgi:UDP-N-acetylglucosamine:LPS N-acetylglucosamine transferase